MVGQSKSTAVVQVKKEVVDIVAQRIRAYQSSKQIALPADYSVENAMKSAWLILQETVDKDKRRALDVCSQTSIANALLDMAVQGLNPAKDQCYFIVYSNKLMCQRSYFGTMAVCQRVTDATDIIGEVVYQGDEFAYEIQGNRRVITKHVQKIENINPNAIIAAYGIVDFTKESGKRRYTDIMTFVQIQKSWSKSRMHSNDVQRDFPDEMARRTVINRACKALINSSSDKALLAHINRTDEELVEEQVNEEIADHANQKVIDVVTGEITEEKPESEKPKPAPAQKAEKKAEVHKCCVCGATEGISPNEHGDYYCEACMTGKSTTKAPF